MFLLSKYLYCDSRTGAVISLELVTDRIKTNFSSDRVWEVEQTLSRAAKVGTTIVKRQTIRIDGVMIQMREGDFVRPRWTLPRECCGQP